VKIAAIIIGIIFVIILLIAGGGYVWWQNNGEEFMQSAQEGIDEGRQAGKGISQSACLDLTIEKAKSCSSINCTIRYKAFIQSCFAVAEQDLKFCATVPGPDEWIETGKWAAETCASKRADNQYCSSIINEVGGYCAANQ